MAEKDPEQRVVITGMGAFTPAGPDLATTYENIASGMNCIVDVSDTELASYEQYRDPDNSERTSLSAVITDFSPLAFLRDEYKTRDIKPSLIHRSGDMVVKTAIEALSQAGVLTDDYRIDSRIGLNEYRFGIRIGTGVGGALQIAEAKKKMEQGKKLGPFPIMESLPGRVASVPSMFFEARGDVAGVLGECAASLIAIRQGAQLIERGDADLVLAGGTEGPIIDVGLGMFAGTTALAKTSDPEKAPAPFDQEPGGVVLGTGAGVVVLQSLESARRTGTVPLAEIVGHAQNMDAGKETFPTGPHARNVMRWTLNMARQHADIEQLEIVAHATGTEADKKEAIDSTQAYSDVEIVGVKAPKDQLGHLGGAIGAVALILGIESQRRNELLGSYKLRNPIPEAKWYMPRKTVELEGFMGAIATHAFGFGGYNCSIITVPVTDY